MKSFLSLRIVLAGVVIAFGLANVPGNCFADLVYDQGASPNTFSRSDEPDFGRRTADDFELTSPDTIRSVSWQGVYFPTGNATSFDDFTVYFYADGGNTPVGAPLASFNVGNNVNRTAAGFNTSGFVFPVYNYHATLDTGLFVAANTRTWISIVNNTSGFSQEWGWATRFPDSTQILGPAHRSSDGGVTWPEVFGNDNLTFSLYNNAAIPEPTLSLALALGMIGLTIRRRR